MRVFRRQISRWWLVLAVPLAALLLPVLLILFFAANNLAHVIFGPPALWNRPGSLPPRSALVGTYMESERAWDQTAPAKAKFELRADGSASASNLPCQLDIETCVLSGLGTWSGPERDESIRLDFSKSRANELCHSGDGKAYAHLELAGHSQPYRLYLVIDDPDSGTGIWFKKQP